MEWPPCCESDTVNSLPERERYWCIPPIPLAGNITELYVKVAEQTSHSVESGMASVFIKAARG